MPVAPALFGLPEWGSRLVVVGFVLVAAALLLWLLTRFSPRITDRAVKNADIVKTRQRRTALTLLFTALRYLLAIAAIVAVAFALAGGASLAAVGGGALLVVVIGFASQRLLTDIIAGFFILFENQYGVGDFVRLEPSGIAGVVDEVGIRTTVVRDLNGDVCHIPNGQITAVRRVPKGWRSFQVKLITRDPDALTAVVTEVASLAPTGSARFLRPPRVSDRRDLGGGMFALRLRAEVAPSLEWLVEEFLVNAVAARAGDLLVAPPMVFSLDSGVVERYQAGLALP
jgi:moderate conductance mechanosensitive channel